MPGTGGSAPEDSGERRESRLLIRYHALGDVVLSTGIARLAALGGPGVPPVDLDVAVDARFLPVYRGNPHVRRLWDRLDLERQAGDVRYDRVVDLQGTMGSRRLASRLSRNVATVRTRSAARRWIVLWGDRFPRPSIPHSLERYGELLACSPGPAEAAPSVWVTAEEEAEAGREAPGVFDSAPGQAVILMPGASRRSKEYLRFDEVCSGLQASGRKVWWVVAPGAPDPAPGAVPGALVLRLSLGSLKAVCARAGAAVTCDSGPMHLARAAGLPVAAVFCSSVQAFGFAPAGPGAMVLEPGDLACRPCGVHGRNRCWLGHWRCVLEVDPTRVVRETLRLLERHARPEGQSLRSSG